MIPVLTEERIRALDETVQAVCGYLAGGRMMSAVDSSIQTEMLETMQMRQQCDGD